jgi:hypothetical protein
MGKQQRSGELTWAAWSASVALTSSTGWKMFPVSLLMLVVDFPVILGFLSYKMYDITNNLVNEKLLLTMSL